MTVFLSSVCMCVYLSSVTYTSSVEWSGIVNMSVLRKSTLFMDDTIPINPGRLGIIIDFIKETHFYALVYVQIRVNCQHLWAVICQAQW